MQIISPSETRTVLENISWDLFVELSEQRRGSVPRMTFDEGVLELMSPLLEHESIGSLVARLVETYTEVRNIEIRTVASTTFKRKDLQKAFEADESYYIKNAGRMPPKRRIDLKVDPPPDLVIEIEITSSAIHKLKLFAAMGVPEVWRHDGEHLEMFALIDGQYQPTIASVALPELTVSIIETNLERRFELGETALIREFRRSLNPEP